MNPVYVAKLGLKVWPKDVRVQKIDRSPVEMFEMVLASFQVNNKFGKSQFFYKTFLLANISMEVVLGMYFLIFSNANVLFLERELTWRSYILAEALPITK